MFAPLLLLAVTRIAWIGESITESADVTCDVACKLCALLNSQTCTITGEYLNATAASTDSDVNAGVSAGTGAVYTGSTYEVVNLGDSGDQITSDIAGRYCSQVAAAAPAFDTVIKGGGHNDLRSGVGAPGQLGSDGESAAFLWSGAGAASYGAMVDDACRIQGMKVVMVSVPPWKGASGWTQPKQDETTTFNTSMASAATAGGVVAGSCTGRISYVNLWPSMDANSDEVCDNCPDGIHPNDTGYTQIAAAVFAQGSF